MKKNIITSLLTPAILIMLNACAGSRVNSATQTPVHQTGYTNVGNAMDSQPLLRSEINIRAVRHFMKTFPSVRDEKWFVITNGYMVKYKQEDSVSVRVDYDVKGNWSYTIRYYNEKKLPKDVRKLVRSTWYDYTISTIEELQIDTNFIYIVHIHDGDDWKMIRVADGEATEIFPPNKAELLAQQAPSEEV